MNLQKYCPFESVNLDCLFAKHFMEGGKLENPEKNPQSKERINNKLNSHMTQSGSRTWVTVVRGERSHRSQDNHMLKPYSTI
jgi:hypothetical protein